MSVRTMSMVWDLPCPSTHNDIQFRPAHKWVLMAYVDHADHFGKNIFPSVATIAKKTGFEERSIQRLTRDLEEMRFLVADGVGRNGTNRWKYNTNKGGDSLSPLEDRGDIPSGDIPSGDIPSGDIPSGDTRSPELIKELNIYKYLEKYLRTTAYWQKFSKQLEKATSIETDGEKVIVTGLTHYETLQEQYSASINRALTIGKYKEIDFTP